MGVFSDRGSELRSVTEKLCDITTLRLQHAQVPTGRLCATPGKASVYGGCSRVCWTEEGAGNSGAAPRPLPRARACARGCAVCLCVTCLRVCRVPACRVPACECVCLLACFTQEAIFREARAPLIRTPIYCAGPHTCHESPRTPASESQEASTTHLTFPQLPRTPNAPRSEHYFLETTLRAPSESRTCPSPGLPCTIIPIRTHAFLPATASPEVPTSSAAVPDVTSPPPTRTAKSAGTRPPPRLPGAAASPQSRICAVSTVPS